MNELINDNGHFTYFGKNLLIYNSKFKNKIKLAVKSYCSLSFSIFQSDMLQKQELGSFGWISLMLSLYK